MVQRMAALGLAWLCILAVVAGYSRAAGEENPSLMAVVIDVYDKSMLVEPLENESARASAGRIMVPTEGALGRYAPQPGDQVVICYDGELMETYPAQISEVYSIRAAG